MSGPVAFFEKQFRRQVASHEFALNPFEEAALPYLKGRVLDLGCGLGNLALEAGRRGCDVLAVDASPTAVERINRDAAAANLKVRAVAGDIGAFPIEGNYDTVVSIGLLMFFPREMAIRLLRNIQAHVDANGCAIVNVLAEGTTFLEMFCDSGYTLFGGEELERLFAGWAICLSRRDDFAAPGGTRKVFSTVIARKAAPRLQ
jgi:tellurite methyltransferase